MNFDVDGNLNWSKTYDFGKAAEPYSVSQTFDGGYIIAGRINGKMLVLKLDNMGNVLWSEILEGGDQSNYPHAIKQTIDTGYIISGNSIDNEPFFVNAFLLKLSPGGNVEWSKSFHSKSNFNDGLDVMEENGFMMAMWTGDSTMLVKTDQLGNLLWAKRYLPTEYNEPLFPFARLQKTAAKRYTMLSPIINYSAESDVFMELNDAGEVLWARQIDMYAVDAIKTNDNGFLIVGNGPLATPKAPDRWEPQIGLIKTDSLGQNSSLCINDVAVNEAIAVIESQTISFTLETIGATTSQTGLQLVSEPLTVRLGCVDVTGAVDENNLNAYIRIFPNPTSGIFTIQTINGEQLNSLEIFNAFGKPVYRADGLKMKEVKVNISSNSPGIYVLKLRINNRVLSRKILVI